MKDTKTMIEQAYSAFNTRDIDGALALMTQDVSWPKASEGGNVVGKEEIRAYWTRQWSEFDPRVEPIAVNEDDQGRTHVRVHQVVKSLEGNILSDSEVLHVFTMNGSLISAMSLGDDADPIAGRSAAFLQQLPTDYEISTDTDRLNVDVIHQFLKESYWSPGIPRAIVERAIQNSLCFGVYHATGQVGFARIVTDRSTFALLADVFILEEHRGKGLSKQLMRSVVEHEDLQGLRRFLLLTSDAHGLYRQFGFEEIGNAWRFMEVLRKDLYGSTR